MRVEELLIRAEELADAGQWLEARSLYSKLCKLQPADDDAWFMDGSLSMDLGDVERAEASLDKALALNSEHPDALYVRASLAQTQGNLHTALDLCLRSVAADPDYAEAWCLLAGLQGATGRYSDAVASSTRATTLDPMMVDAFLIQSRALQALGKLPEAVEACHSAIRISPERAGILSAVGRILLELGQLGDAERHLQKALELDPGLPDARRSLGLLLRGKSDLRGALQQYQIALSLDQDDLESLVRVSMLRWELDEIPEAVACCFEVFDKDPDNLAMRQIFPQMLGDIAYPPEMLARIRGELIQTFSFAGIDYEGLFAPALRLLHADAEIHDMIQSLSAGDPAQAEGGILHGNISRLLHDALFLEVLCKTTVCDLALERVLTKVRRACLNLVARGEAPQSLITNSYIFPASLAYQCFHGEYLYAVDADQAKNLEVLENAITTGIQDTDIPQPLWMLRVIVYAMYRPLHTHHSIDLIDKHLSKCDSGCLSMLLKQQVADIRRERQLRSRVRVLTTINAELSKAVEAEYDASPYPRWLSAGGYTPEPCRAIFRRRYPEFRDPGFDMHPLKVLVAGCGTGRHAILTASRFTDAQVLAIDLSTASLAYAERMVEEMGVDNISFQQADIMELSTVTEKFHVIEAGGVLHNLKDPYEAVGILSDRLEEKGLLYISTYRESARKPVLTAREFIRQKGRSKTPDGIRQARLDIIAESSTNPAFRNLCQWRDFFTLSESRFLLYDVHEHTFEIDDIYAMLDACGLRLLGFELEKPQDVQCYRARNPDDPAVSNRDKARAFESDHPSAFSGQYRFWCQKM